MMYTSKLNWITTETAAAIINASLISGINTEDDNGLAT